MTNYINSISKLINSKDNPEKIKILLKEFIVKNISNLECKVHPLGFYVFILGKTNDESIIRLHIWDGTLQKQNSELEIHNHIFNMTSLILFGSLINQSYDVNESSNAEGFLYEVDYINNNSILKKVKNNIALIVLGSEKIKTDEFYTIKKSLFHNTYIEEKYVATILKTEIDINKKPLLYSKIDFDDSKIEFKRETVGNNKKINILEHLVSKI